ncbi:Prolidase [Francisella salina]|uniref:Prolidase n=1 Tax=Francisella salina TaxID=573569 RepID=A0ABM5M9S4_FRAST|nr:Prolidase [Francisella salina]AEI35961.1 Prolidase [Francisella salina]
MAKIILKNANVFNGKDNQINHYNYVYVEDNKILSLTDNEISNFSAEVIIDLKDRFLMPGLYRCSCAFIFSSISGSSK